MLLPSDAPIPQNALDSIPLDQQNWDDYNTGRVLVSAMEARRVASCVPPASTWSEYGPIVENEVATGLATTQANLSTEAQTLSDLQNAIDAGGAYITDSDINTAPIAEPLGSAGGGLGPIYTPSQIAAATTSPVNNTLAVSFHPNRRRKISASRQGVDLTGGDRRGGGGRGGGAGQRPAYTGPTPGSPWNQPSTGRCQPSLSDVGPWGKVFLFGGLGLIAVGLFNRK
jgi:hypothetical protein